MPEPTAREVSGGLHAQVQAAVAAGGLSEAAFDALALSIARYQADHVPACRRLAQAAGVDLTRATVAAAIPAVPTDVFRLTRVAAFPSSEELRVFRTSGTTAGARGAHAFRTLATYEAAALAWGAPHLWPDVDRIERAVVLAPPSAAAPDSSLSFMVDLFVDHLDATASWHVDPDRAALDHEGLARACAAARAAGRPCLLFGTSFAFVWAIDASGVDLALPPGSRAMITGGYKGKTREVDERALREGLSHRFAIDPARIVGEYGMTELSSQLYEPRLAGAEGGAYRAPPWVRVAAVDPASLAPVPPGEEGIARIVDLANVDSAVAVQTADRVRVRPGGDIELFGRLPGATPRGCSLAIEELRAIDSLSG